jgi:hypothetical protein
VVRNSPITFLMGICLLIFPINIYIIGDWIGVGIQSAILNYKSTYLGTSLTHAFLDLNYVMSGVVQGKTAMSILAWFVGFLFLMAGLIAIILERYRVGSRAGHRSGYIYYIAGFLLLISIFLQYGVLFFGPPGISIPVGIPLIFYFGWYQLHVHERSKSESIPALDEADENDTGDIIN